VSRSIQTARAYATLIELLTMLDDVLVHCARNRLDTDTCQEYASELATLVPGTVIKVRREDERFIATVARGQIVVTVTCRPSGVCTRRFGST